MKKILLIEPDRRLAALYSGALEAANISVDHAPTAQYGLSCLDNNAYDGIVLELDMPDHNGFEFLYEFCSYDDWSSIPIIVNTSLPTERFKPMMVLWEELNIVEYLYKGDSSLSKLQSAVSSMAPLSV